MAIGLPVFTHAGVGNQIGVESMEAHQFFVCAALGHLTAGILLCVTIIGIPLGLANFKLIPISLVPLGVRIVPSDELYPGYTALSVPERLRRQ